MATKIKNAKRRRLTTGEQLARLCSEVARLRSELRELKARASAEAVPALPPCDADGNYPATQTLRVILAQQIIRRRKAAGWTQAELAERAGVRQETVCRIEQGKNAPNVTTVDKLDRALKEAGV